MVGTNTSGPRKAAAAKTGHPKTSKNATAKRTGAIVALDSKRSVPALPNSKDFLASTRKGWDEYWKSPVAAMVSAGSDMAGLVRLFSLVDEFERCYREFAGQRIVTGSKGQSVINPLGPFMMTLAREARALEDRFGGNIISRLRLSIDLNSAATSLDALNARLAADDSDDETSAETDPRSRFGDAIDVDPAP